MQPCAERNRRVQSLFFFRICSRAWLQDSDLNAAFQSQVLILLLLSCEFLLCSSAAAPMFAMFFKLQLASFALCALFFSQVNAHGTITAVQGANGVNGQGFGIIASTPRNGGLPVPFEQDTSIIRNNEISSGQTGVCGRTKAGGNNDVAQQLAAASSTRLPSAGSDGSVTMTLHQVNQDGAGPYSCDVSGDGGNTFTDAQVTQNVPGVASLSLAVAKDFPLVAQMPTGMQCTGGPNGDACIVRCRNKAIAGPFGSCVAVTNSNAGNSTTSVAATGVASEAAATPAAADVSTAAGSKGNGGGFLGGLAKGFGARSDPESKKRYIASRVAGKRAGLWLDA
ncbi:hypothetical protein ACEPAF_2671 [Sanghuangporus sanghuang]